MAIIPFFNPETKAKEIIEQLNLYFSAGAYLNDECEIKKIEQDISFLPNENERICCTISLLAVQGKIDDVFQIFNKVKKDQKISYDVINYVLSSTIRLCYFSRAYELFDKWVVEIPKNMLTMTLIKNSLCSICYGNKFSDLIKKYEELNSSNKDAHLISGIKNISQKVLDMNINTNIARDIMNVAGEVLQENDMLCIGVSSGLDWEDVFTVSIKIKATFEKYLELSEELEERISLRIPSYPHNINVGFWLVE